MTQEQDESGASGLERSGAGRSGNSGPEVGFLPPLPVPVDAPDVRYAKLSRIVAELVVPRLMALHEQVRGRPSATTGTGEIAALAQLVLSPQSEDATGYLIRLRDQGVSLDSLYADLLEPAARHLGDLWNEDKIDFVDVTLGVARLQRIVHVFGGLGAIEAYDAKRKVLLAVAPGEQHSYGSAIVQKFLRAAGWHVWTCTTPRLEEAADVAAQEWFGVIGFSLGSDIHHEALASAIARVRELSMNRKVGIMVGGSAIARNPQWVETLGADGTAANGPATVVLAKKLLAASLG
jgi:methanogenic corrinoid protein MtbC1